MKLADSVRAFHNPDRQWSYPWKIENQNRLSIDVQKFFSACHHKLQLRMYCNMKMQLSLGLTFPHNKFSPEVFLPDIHSFCNPVVKPDFLDPTEIVDLHVVRVILCCLGNRRQKWAWEIIAVTAQVNTFCFDTIQCGASVWRYMEMLPFLLPAAFTGYLILWNSYFLMDHLGKLICQVIFMDSTVKTVKAAWSC